MKIIRYGIGAFLAAQLVFSWTPSSVQGQDYYEDPNKKILKNAIVGAGSGAVASGASGGDAGKGALIGAGTTVIGSAALDMLTTPSPQPPQPQVQYVQQTDPGYVRAEAPRRSGGCGRNG